MTILFVAWGYETLRDRRSPLAVRLFLWGIVIGVIVLALFLSMHFAQARDLDRRYLVVAAHFGDGSVWYDKAEAMLLPAGECAGYAGSYGDGVDAACYRPGAFRALHSSPPTVAELRARR